MTKKVGYGSPPTHSQWQKGQSGNPKGRKKGSRSFKSDLLDELGEVIAITEARKPKRITKLRAIIKSQVAKAIKGDVRAASVIMAWHARMVAADQDGVTEPPLEPHEQAALDRLMTRLGKTKPSTSTKGGDDE